MSDEETRIELETDLAECQLRYRVFEEKLDNVNEQQKTINRHTFELRQMMTWFMGAAASFVAISVVLGIFYSLSEIF